MLPASGRGNLCGRSSPGCNCSVCSLDDMQVNGMKLNEENQGFDLFVLQGDMNDRCPRFSIILLFAVFYSFPSEIFFSTFKIFHVFLPRVQPWLFPSLKRVWRSYVCFISCRTALQWMLRQTAVYILIHTPCRGMGELPEFKFKWIMRDDRFDTQYTSKSCSKERTFHLY